MTRWTVAAASCLLIPGLTAQDGPTARAFCDPTDARNRCPADCRCTDDVLAIRFERSSSPILEVDDEPGLSIEAAVVLETKSGGVQAWTYGVRHDGKALAIESVTTAGTDAGLLFFEGFNALDLQGLMDCTLDPDPRCLDPQPGTGFLAGAVLSLTHSVMLPAGTSSIAKATYRLEPSAAKVAEGVIFIEFTEKLAFFNSPPTSINFTVNDRSTQPGTVVDGRILLSLAGQPFHRGDPDADGRLSVADAVALLLFLFLAGPAPGCLDAGDLDDDGRIDTADPVLLLRWLFLGGSAPALPGPPPAPCGPDPKVPGQKLGCDAYEGCLP